jgi:hypothetical protein
LEYDFDQIDYENELLLELIKELEGDTEETVQKVDPEYLVDLNVPENRTYQVQDTPTIPEKLFTLQT